METPATWMIGPDRCIEEMPPTAHRVAQATVLTLAAVAAVDHGVHALELGLLALAVSPWAANSLWSRALPRAVVFLTCMAVVNLAGYELGFFDEKDGGQLSLMLLMWVVGEYASTTRPRLHVPVTAAAALIVVLRPFGPAEAGATSGWLIGVAVAYAVGTMLRMLMQANARLRHAQHQLAAHAVAEERARIAREVHDVVAHSLTVTMLHVTAARMAIDRSPDRAREALEEAERQGRRSLDDIRRTVGLLRTHHDGATDAALPGLADVEALTEEYRAAGMSVDLIIEADVDGADLTPAAELAGYRVVQEGLSNVAKHAPGAGVVVRLQRDGGHMEISVRDEGAKAATATDGRGTGLIGMAERVSQVGGEVAHGPMHPGWEVVARIPIAPGRGVPVTAQRAEVPGAPS